jgi:hypothetical protein
LLTWQLVHAVVAWRPASVNTELWLKLAPRKLDALAW